MTGRTECGSPLGLFPRVRRTADEDGSILLLTILYGIVALVLVLVAVASTSLYLERKRLLTLADGAALAGAEAFELGTVVVDGGEVRTTLTPAAVERAARDYLAAAPHAAFDGLALTRATTIDGQSATVSLSASWRPPVLVLLLPSGIDLSVTSAARSVFW
jgi:hypothetical protein